MFLARFHLPYRFLSDKAKPGHLPVSSAPEQKAVSFSRRPLLFSCVSSSVPYLFSCWSLSGLFAHLFAPAAMLIGVPIADVPEVADLLGTKLVANEFVAFVKLTGEYRPAISQEAFAIATYALTGFANFGSIGIQLGGIGAMAPNRRGDLARLGSRALLAGFLATMINAAIASILV